MITTQVSLQHSASGLQTSPTPTRRINLGTALSIGIANIGTSNEAIPIGDIASPREVLIRNLGPNVCRFSLNGSTYPLGLAINEVMVLSLDCTRETQTVTVIAATTAQAADYVTLDALSGTWAVWLYIGSGTAPGGYDQTLRVDLVDGDTGPQVAAKLYAAMIASTEFSADFVTTYTTGAAIVTITDRATGTRTTATVGTSGYTVTKTVTGLPSPEVTALSEGKSSIQYAVGEF